MVGRADSAVCVFIWVCGRGCLGDRSCRKKIKKAYDFNEKSIINMQMPDLKGVRDASENLRDVSVITPLSLNERLSEKFNSRIFLKREDLQKVRSFKIRGAFNKIKSLNLESRDDQRQIICASAGNHAQGFAYSCNKLKIYGKIYMPVTTPKQKIEAWGAPKARG